MVLALPVKSPLPPDWLAISTVLLDNEVIALMLQLEVILMLADLSVRTQNVYIKSL